MGGSKKTTQTTIGTQNQSGSQSGFNTGTSSGRSSGTSSLIGTRTGSATGSTTSTGSTRNIYDWLQNPGSADINALRDYREEIDPNVAATFGRRQRNLQASFRNPLGANMSRSIREATERSAQGDIEQDYGAARRQAYNDARLREGQRKLSLAELTKPQLVQTGQDTTGRTTSEQQSREDSSQTGTSSSEYSGEQSGAYGGQYTGQGSSNQQTTTVQPSNKLGSILQGAGMFFSDAALKENIRPLPEELLERFLQLQGVLFDWNERASKVGLTGTELGLVAQDVEKVFPEYVCTDALTGYKKINYSALLALLIETLKYEVKRKKE